MSVGAATFTVLDTHGAGGGFNPDYSLWAKDELVMTFDNWLKTEQGERLADFASLANGPRPNAALTFRLRKAFEAGAADLPDPEPEPEYDAPEDDMELSEADLPGDE